MNIAQTYLSVFSVPHVIGLAAFFVGGGWYLIASGRHDAILFFSEHRTPLLDSLFITATKLAEAPGYIACALAALAFRWYYIVPLAITSACVYAASALFKSSFRASRPVDVLATEGMLPHINLVQGIELQSGFTSFPSGHSISAFALAGIMIMLFRPAPWVAALLLLIATLAGVSRVYLVQHFWADVYAGAFIGTIIAAVIARTVRQYQL
jgi:membrane-associated phospholipid phosphatase